MAQPYWSVGPKIGYTFGKDGGFTVGVEASYFPYYRSLPFPGGFSYTFDFTHWQDHTSLHVGAQFASIIGMDVGPTIFFNGGKVHPGVSIIPWIGAFLYPYFELDIPFEGPSYQSTGGYIKFPVGHTNAFDFSFG